MAHVFALDPQGLLSRKQGLLARLRQDLANYREYRRVYEELNVLSDRDLGDIGLSRCNISEVAKEAARR